MFYAVFFKGDERSQDVTLVLCASDVKEALSYKDLQDIVAGPFTNYEDAARLAS